MGLGDIIQKSYKSAKTVAAVAVLVVGLTGCYGPSTQHPAGMRKSRNGNNVGANFIQGNNRVSGYTRNGKPVYHGQTTRTNPVTPSTRKTVGPHKENW